MNHDWPKISDRSDFNGMQLLTPVYTGKSPFRGVGDVNVLRYVQL